MPRVQDAIPSLDCRAWTGRSNPLLLNALRFATESRPAPAASRDSAQVEDPCLAAASRHCRQDDARSDRRGAASGARLEADETAKRRRQRMIRIAINAKAFAAIERTLPLGSVGSAPTNPLRSETWPSVAAVWHARARRAAERAATCWPHDIVRDRGIRCRVPLLAGRSVRGRRACEARYASHRLPTTPLAAQPRAAGTQGDGGRRANDVPQPVGPLQQPVLPRRLEGDALRGRSHRREVARRPGRHRQRAIALWRLQPDEVRPAMVGILGQLSASAREAAMTYLP